MLPARGLLPLQHSEGEKLLRQPDLLTRDEARRIWRSSPSCQTILANKQKGRHSAAFHPSVFSAERLRLPA